MAKRLLDDWIASHLEYTDYSESPLSYHTWAAVSCISSVLQRRVYIEWEVKIFPNLYVVLVGPSANARKGLPLDIARDLLSTVNVSLMAENPTPEAFIREMKAAENSYLCDTTKNYIFHSSVSVVVEELSVMLGQQNIQFLSYLTNWYDSRYKWTRRTKHQGTDEILGVCLNMLASTAPDWLPSILTKEAVGGGFTSRCIFVVEERKRKTVLDPTIYKRDKKLKAALIHDLEMMLYLSGRFDWEDDAKEAYIEWYREEDKLLEQGRKFSDPALNSYAGRRTTHLRKLMMCMCASRNNEMLLSLNDFERAKALLENTEKKMHTVYGGLGRSKYAHETEMVITYLKSKGTCLRSELLQDLYRDLDETALESIMNILIQMKSVKSKILSGSNDRKYEYIGP